MMNTAFQGLVARSLVATCLLLASIFSVNAFAQLTVYVVRHGQTDWNKDDRIQGGTDNPRRAEEALKTIGKKQASGGTVVIVGHGGINPLLVSHLTGAPPQEGANAINQGNDEIYQIVLSKTGAAAVWKLIPRSNLGEL